MTIWMEAEEYYDLANRLLRGSIGGRETVEGFPLWCRASSARKYWDLITRACDRSEAMFSPGGSMLEDMVDISLGINGTVLRVTPETTVKFEKMDFRGSGENAGIRTLLALEEGRILGSAILIGHESRYEIKTPTGVTGLRGDKSLFECAVKRRGTPVGEEKPTRQLSFQPVAAEAGMEAMKCPKPLV